MIRNGDWIQTYTGRKFWPLNPRAEDIHIHDIAHALSMKCRFNGHSKQFYSVAEHSVLVSRYVQSEYAMWGLLHDAAEAYLPDVPRPVKPFLSGFKEIETSVMNIIADVFELGTYIEPPEVKRIDTAILADEQKLVMGEPPDQWVLPEPPIGDVDILFLRPNDAFTVFMERFNQLEFRRIVKSK